jgi:hypothetical protein
VVVGAGFTTVQDGNTDLTTIAPRSVGTCSGPQRIQPLEALKAKTLWSAYQHFEESTKASIEAGKVADLVVLSDNPMTIEPAKIVNIKVLETIKSGKSIYKRPAQSPSQLSGTRNGTELSSAVFTHLPGAHCKPHLPFA